MLRRVGDRQVGPIRQHLDAALALSKLLQEHETVCVRQRFCDGGELGE
jgi:hypothetical protein